MQAERNILVVSRMFCLVMEVRSSTYIGRVLFKKTCKREKFLHTFVCDLRAEGEICVGKVGFATRDFVFLFDSSTEKKCKKPTNKESHHCPMRKVILYT